MEGGGAHGGYMDPPYPPIKPLKFRKNKKAKKTKRRFNKNIITVTLDIRLNVCYNIAINNRREWI
jgi:hypothetical protein